MAAKKQTWRSVAGQAWQNIGGIYGETWEKGKEFYGWVAMLSAAMWAFSAAAASFKKGAPATPLSLAVVAGVFACLIGAIVLYFYVTPLLLMAAGKQKYTAKTAAAFSSKARWRILSTGLLSLVSLFPIALAVGAALSWVAIVFSGKAWGGMVLGTSVMVMAGMVLFLYPMRCYSTRGFFEDLKESARKGWQLWPAYLVVMVPLALLQVVAAVVIRLIFGGDLQALAASNMIYIALPAMVVAEVAKYFVAMLSFVVYHRWVHTKAAPARKRPMSKTRRRG